MRSLSAESRHRHPTGLIRAVCSSRLRLPRRRIAASILAHVEIIGRSCTTSPTALVVEHALEPVELRGRDLRSADATARRSARGRRQFAGQPFADDHGKRVLDRRVGASVISSYLPRWKRSSSIAAGSARLRHGGADRHDAGLLVRLEHRARLLAAGHG
jgi:hypothetical protein